MEVTTIDIKNVCRTCLLPSSDLEVIFTVYFENDSITKILNDVGKIEINKEDNLSHFLCIDCKHTAINAYRFQQMCMESDRSLRILVGNCDQDVVENESKFIEEDPAAENILVEKLGDDDDLLEDMNDDIIYEEETDEDEEEDEELDGEEESSDNDSAELIFSCTECSKLFNSNEKLKKHVEKQHDAQKQAQGTNEEEEESEDTDDEKGSKNKWACKDCDKVYKRKNILDRHRRFTHGYVKRPHRCVKCDKAFPYSSALTRHEILHSDIVERSKLKRDESYVFVCVICAKEFNLPELLTSHLKSHKTKGDDDQQFTCKLCHDDFSSYSEILRHSKNHIENATHQCSLCNKLLSIGDELIDHFLRHKGNNSPK